MSRRILLAVTAALMIVGGCASGDSDENVATAPLALGAEATYEYTVPEGTGLRIDNGEVITLMPSRLEVKVGESIRIINEDDRDYMIGVFFVKAKQSLAMQFTNPGTLSGTCDMSADGEFVITVSD